MTQGRAAVTQGRAANEERVRLFLALELPERARRALVTWRSRAVGELLGLRAVAPERLHVTLCFLGWRAAGEVEAIGAACRALDAQAVPHTCSLADAIWLPTRRPRVLAVGLNDPDGLLAGVQSALFAALQTGGWYTPEERPFRAHVTVARVMRGARAPRMALVPVPALAFDWSVLTLYRSRLGPGGVTYEALVRVDLPVPVDGLADALTAWRARVIYPSTVP